MTCGETLRAFDAICDPFLVLTLLRARAKRSGYWIALASVEAP